MSAFGQENDLNMVGLLREVWAARAFLVVGLCVGFLIAFGIVAVSVPKFEARMMVGPAQPLETLMQARFDDGQNSYLFGAERGRASGEVVSNFVRFEAMVRGGSVARLLLRDARIVDGVKADRAFVFDGGQGDVDPAELAQYIDARVGFDRFGETPLKEIVYRHRDGAFAAYFLQQIHRVSDQLIRAELRGQVDERIAYLERVIAKTVNPEQRRIITNLLLEQERARMMVSMDAPVAAAVIEPAASGARAVWPDKGLFYSVFGVLGLMVGYLVFGLVNYREQENVSGGRDRRDSAALRGEELQHKPKRPLKYGSWFQNAPDNDVAVEPRRGKRDTSDAAE